jgi:SNF2 family DNA or RNA helicase
MLKSQIVLTTFGIVLSQRKLSKQYQPDKKIFTFYDFDWFRIIVDEADNLRNHKTCAAKWIQ